MTCTYEFDPDSNSTTTLTDTWSCPHETHSGTEYCPVHMPPALRDETGVTDEDITAFINTYVKADDPDLREFIGGDIPVVDLDYADIEAEDQHPVDFRHATIRNGVTVTQSRFEEHIDFRDAEINGFDASNCDFENGVLCTRAEFTGPVTFFEVIATGDDVDFSNAVFHDEVTFDEADFNEDVSFNGAVFEAPATFEGTEFYGRANSIGDNTSFDNATFEAETSFFHGNFEFTSFRNATFEADVSFEKATADGSMLFPNSDFNGAADFDEVRFEEDTSFKDAAFNGETQFRGASFNGGAALLDDDVSFENAAFAKKVTFKKASFRYANFTHVTFAAAVDFELSSFDDDAIFKHGEFDGIADFDEVTFSGDADFSNAVFRENAVFRGSEFEGGTDYHEDDGIFTDAVFAANADFTKTVFTAGNFIGVAFKGSADFTEAEFTDDLHLKVTSFGDDTYLNFTEAVIQDGSITQPSDGWVRFDMTEATLGDVSLRAETPDDERELLDYFRFCDTTFNEFDFSNHTSYLDRNNWNLHEFDAGTQDYEFAVEMTPEIIEKTYLKAKKNASAQSNVKAAGEFRVKRQEHARDKFVNIARDTTEDLGTRGRNLLRAVENLFLGISCGYGLRLYRITGVFIIFPSLAAAIFALGGPLFETGAGQTTLTALLTPAGLETFAINVYFSYITFLTIGYGNIAPIGMGARFLAASLVYLNVILAGLFLYALIKRSEI